MNVILSNIEVAFYHLISFSSFEPFILLVLFGITFQLKEWKALLALLMALSIGSIVGLLVCSLDVLNLTVATIKLILAAAILTLGMQNLFASSHSASTLRYNLFALLGIILGIGVYIHYQKHLGSQFSLYPFIGYNLGAILSYLLISFASMLLSSLIMLVFKTDRRSFNLVISGIGIGVSLVLIYLRY